MAEQTLVYTVQEVAGLLKISEASVYRMISDGQLLSFRVRGDIRVTRAELARFTSAEKGVSHE